MSDSDPVERIRAAYRTLFGSPAASVVLKDLADQFDPPQLARGDTTEVLIAAAQRDVVRYIEEMAGRDA